MTVNTDSKPTTKKQLVKVLKDAGVSNEEIKMIVYPDQTPTVAKASLSRALKDNNVQFWVADSFEGTGLDLHELILQYKSELSATKSIYHKGELIEDVPDYGVRQKARDAIIKLMQAHTPAVDDPNPLPPASAPVAGDTPLAIDANAREAMLAAIKKGDIKTIERIVFKDVS